MTFDASTGKPLSAPRSIGRRLNFAASAANAVCNRILDPHGLTLAQWAVLVCLWRNGELGIKEIARLTGNAPPATSRIVDRMVSSGLVLRRPDREDRRAVVVGLSAKGESLRHLHAVYEDVNAVLLGGLSQDEAEQLFLLLERIEQAGRDWIAAKG